MKFVQRFAYYLIGLVIGLFFVGLVFSGKNTKCNYFPNARVLNDIRNKPFEYSPTASKILSQTWIDTTDITNTLKYGNVNFDRSSTDFDKDRIYVIEGKTAKNQEFIMTVRNKDNKAVLENILKK